MPKRYPVEVQLFAAQKRGEGHSWDKVAEMVRKQFSLDSAPSRRQMAKWVAKNSLADVVIKEISHRLPRYAPEWLSTQQDALARVFAEAMRGKEFNILLAKWLFSQMKATLGPQQVTTAWAEFTAEEELLQQDSNASGDNKRGAPFTEEIVSEERSS